MPTEIDADQVRSALMLAPEAKVLELTGLDGGVDGLGVGAEERSCLAYGEKVRQPRLGRGAGPGIVSLCPRDEAGGVDGEVGLGWGQEGGPLFQEDVEGVALFAHDHAGAELVGG